MATVTSKGDIYTDYTDLLQLRLDADPDMDYLSLTHRTGSVSNRLYLSNVSIDDIVQLRDRLDELISWMDEKYEDESTEELFEQA